MKPIAIRPAKLTKQEIAKLNEFLADRAVMDRDELAFKWRFHWAHHLSVCERFLREIGLDLPKRDHRKRNPGNRSKVRTPR